ncbi:tripartite tricarboxylate transporter TctB family protein [Ornithinimicrobium murale]|uniref:tripartite tricarboxylate transporter TctB family protein n=1 Tax=Ornithinimicrobium murale TaxID=1050153 RepID=UPI000E0D48BB|nr:tripartite tricarboxylate transporter TctB family protein [Ornithinimicrobium murale]
MNSEQTAVATHSVKDKIFQRVPYAVGALIGLYFLLGAIGLGVGTLSAPAPGLWPSIVAVVLIGCCVVGMLIGGDGEDIEDFAGRLLRPAIGVATLSLFILMFSRFGLVLSGLVVLVIWFRFLARETWFMSVVLAVGATVVTYLLFVQLLAARFPDDVIAQLWGGR